ncbi:MAG: Gfo/Idh/MocA family oxidoreductase [Ruminococcaceae bacterium]|nr:Gfo/Idh/MocA family oxidoreductase [Oscillospiraceae bacterium]
MASKKRVGIIGFGGMGGWHSKFILKSDVVELAGIWDIKEEARQKAVGKGIHVYSSLEDMLGDESVEIVTIATPNDLHKPLAIQAMAAGKNVISEKPVTMSSSDLQEMIDASKKYNKIFTVHQNRRWDKDFLVIKKIYEEKPVGEIFNIESRVQGSHGIPGDWRAKKEHGGGMMLDWGVHMIDQILLMIPERIKKVYAKMDHVTNAECDDGFKLDIYFESGLRVLVEVGTSNFINLPRWYLQGVNGTAVIEDWSRKGKIVTCQIKHDKNVVPVQTSAGLTKTMAPRSEETIKELPLPEVQSDVHDFYRNLVDAIDGKAEQLVTHAQVMRVFKLMEAAFESDRLGQVVDFE